MRTHLSRYLRSFPVQVKALDDCEPPDADCPRDPDGLVSDEQIAADIRQLQAQDCRAQAAAWNGTNNGSTPTKAVLASLDLVEGLDIRAAQPVLVASFEA